MSGKETIDFERAIDRFFDIVASLENVPGLEVEYPDLEHYLNEEYQGKRHIGRDFSRLTRGFKAKLRPDKNEKVWVEMNESEWRDLQNKSGTPRYYGICSILEEKLRDQLYSAEAKGKVDMWYQRVDEENGKARKEGIAGFCSFNSAGYNGQRKTLFEENGMRVKIYACYDGTKLPEFVEKILEFSGEFPFKCKFNGPILGINQEKIIFYLHPENLTNFAEFLADNKEFLLPVGMNKEYGIQLLPGASLFPDGMSKDSTPSTELSDIFYNAKDNNGSVEKFIREVINGHPINMTRAYLKKLYNKPNS